MRKPGKTTYTLAAALLFVLGCLLWLAWAHVFSAFVSWEWTWLSEWGDHVRAIHAVLLSGWALVVCAVLTTRLVTLEDEDD